MEHYWSWFSLPRAQTSAQLKQCGKIFIMEQMKIPEDYLQESFVKIAQTVLKNKGDHIDFQTC